MKENQKLTELMLAIRRNTKPSKCIDVYENLILEINRPEITDIFISEMSGFISKLFELFYEVDKLDNLKLKARILTKDFIKPDSYFKSCKHVANQIMRIRAAIEYQESKYFTLHTKDTERHIILNITDETAPKIIDVWKIFWPNLNNEELKEVARKTMLLYHYIPAIYKALIQTKRRELGLDCNSSKF
jgi:hypothetical protein